MEADAKDLLSIQLRRSQLESLLTTLPPERFAETVGANYDGNRMVTPGAIVRMGGFGANPEKPGTALYMVLRVRHTFLATFVFCHDLYYRALLLRLFAVHGAAGKPSP